MDYLVWVGIGAIGAFTFIFCLQRFANDRLKDVLSIMLAFVAAVYVGPSLGSSMLADVMEVLFASGLTILAIFGLRGSWLLLAAGYFIHGLWDAFHGPVMHVYLPDWYAPACIGYDWVTALYIYVIHRTESSDLATSHQ